MMCVPKCFSFVVVVMFRNSRWKVLSRNSLVGSVVWKMDRAKTGWRQGLAGCLGAWYDPVGERLRSGHRQHDSLEREGGRILRTGAPLGAVERGGWTVSLICFSNSSWKQLALST